MNTKLTIGLLILAIFLTFLVGYLGRPLLFVLLFSLSVWFFILSFLWLGAGMLWRAIPSSIRKIQDGNILHFRFIIIGCFIFFVGSGYAVNHFLLPKVLHPMSLIGDLVILLFSVFIAWCLLKKLNKRIVYAGFFVFILYIGFLWINKSVIRAGSQTGFSEKLGSLAYVKWIPLDQSGRKSGVTIYDPSRSYEGINIYVPRNLPNAYLMDMYGNVLHTWSKAINDDDNWYQAELCKNGDLLTFVMDNYVMKLDWKSHVLWKKDTRAHHDIAIAESGEIWLVTRKDEIKRKSLFPLPVLNDFLVMFSPDGKIKRKISFYEVFKDRFPLTSAIKIYFNMPINFIGVLKHKILDGYLFERHTSYDIFHNNTVELISRDIEGLCRKGDILVSLSQIDTICIIDHKTEKLVWSWGRGHLSRQHHPTLLENGNILIFDNGVNQRRSRIVELDPIKREIVWEYKGSPPETFYSRSRGGNQRLPNGNTLITESDKGHVFEVTREGEVVWEFYNPEVKDDTWRSAIYRLMRITDPGNYPVLDKLHK